MALFRAKKKDIESYETEAALPSFTIDTNGFIMFRDASLGGVAVLEIIPHIATESITHEDPVYHNDSTDPLENPDYEPTVGSVFPDQRRRTYPPWVYFLNSLHQQDDSDEPTHIQIIAKKCMSPEWYTRVDYSIYNEQKNRSRFMMNYYNEQRPHDVLLQARMDDYISLLEETRHNIALTPSVEFDVRKLAAYKTRFFLVISYTPSSEGWWMDGRDTDYYITDNNIVDTLFKNNEDKIVDRVVNIMTSRASKQEEQQRGGQADDFFWIEADRTAQILYTRLQKLYSTINRWEEYNPNCPMPFTIKPLDGREVAALIAFFPNIMTPYWDKIWTLASNQDEVLYRMDVQKALDTWDTSFVNQGQLIQDIADANVDMKHTKQQQDAFLQQYKDKKFEDLEDIFKEHDAAFWSPEREEQQKAWEEEARRQAETNSDIWGDFNSTFAIDEEFKTPDQKRQEFLKKYRNKGGRGSMAGQRRAQQSTQPNQQPQPNQEQQPQQKLRQSAQQAAQQQVHPQQSQPQRPQPQQQVQQQVAQQQAAKPQNTNRQQQSNAVAQTVSSQGQKASSPVNKNNEDIRKQSSAAPSNQQDRIYPTTPQQDEDPFADM